MDIKTFRSKMAEIGLSLQQQNVLEIVRHATTNKVTGEVKKRLSLDCYDTRTVNSLYRRGLLTWAGETIHGSGYAFNAKAFTFK